MVFYLKPVQWIAVILAVIAMALMITSIVTPAWIYIDSVGANQQWGIFQACSRRYGDTATANGGWIDECRYIDNSCQADFSNANQADGVLYTDVPWGNCRRTRTVRAFTIMAAVFMLLSFSPMLATACLFYDLALRLIASFLLFFAAVCGVIALGVFTSMSFAPHWRYGYSYGLMIASWVLAFIAAILTLFPHRIHAPAVAETNKDPNYMNDGIAVHRSSISGRGSAPVTRGSVVEQEMPVRIHDGPVVGEQTLVQQQV